MLEIVADVLHHLLFCSGGEARYGYQGLTEIAGHGILAKLAFLIFLDKLADVLVIHPEVLSPCREAVSFINDESHHMPCHQDALDGFGAQHLWCYI